MLLIKLEFLLLFSVFILYLTLLTFLINFPGSHHKTRFLKHYSLTSTESEFLKHTDKTVLQ